MKRSFSILLGLFLAGCASQPVPPGAAPENFAVVDAQRHVFRGAQPRTPAQWDYLFSIGATNVVKLDTEAEGQDENSPRFNVERLPISGVEQIFGLPGSYLQTIVDDVLPGTYVHCLHGEDRTGLVCACYRVQVQGWPKDKAKREMFSRHFHPELLGLWFAWENFGAGLRGANYPGGSSVHSFHPGRDEPGPGSVSQKPK